MNRIAYCCVCACARLRFYVVFVCADASVPGFQGALEVECNRNFPRLGVGSVLSVT